MSKQITLEEIQDFKTAYPKQLYGLFFSEMWERFCFYGMRGMLTIFMASQLAMSDKDANLQYGATQAWVYAFTFIGGLFADKILGFKKSLLWGGLMMIVGSLFLSIDPKSFFFWGISFLIVGTGFFKPNISSMVGKLYKEGDSRRDAGFSLFYAGINIGATLGGILMIGIAKGAILSNYIPEHLRWNAAFCLVAVVMIISLMTFIFTQKSLGPIGISPFATSENKITKWYEYIVYFGSLASIPIIMVMVANTHYTDIFMYIIGPFSLLYLFYEMRNFTKIENQKLIAALCFILFSVIFWAIFEQAGGSLSLFADKYLSQNLLGLSVLPTQVNNSANSIFVIIFAAPIGLLWVWLSKRKMEPNAVVKFGLGFLFLGLANLIYFSLRYFVGADGLSSLNIFAFAYFIVTMGELCLSPIGLSIMTKLAPTKVQGLMMGMWFLASAYGQYVAGLFGASISPDESASILEKINTYTAGYKQFAWYAIIAGIVLIVISPLIKKLMHGVK
ncbi:MAG TPA: peptide MFS transporter [Chitinophagaceae bacterium]|nr:MAG: amino acid/peptide transporter [Bacteroidetes bacterium OLB11]HMN32831.1 peptide MFS transporter [Chitinophagaceae bacterium]